MKPSIFNGYSYFNQEYPVFYEGGIIFKNYGLKVVVCKMNNQAGSVENTGVELWNPPPYTFKDAYTMLFNVLLSCIIFQ